MLLALLKCLKYKYSNKIKEAVMDFQINKVKDRNNLGINLINKIKI